MTLIRNVALWNGDRRDFQGIPNNQALDKAIDGSHLTALPALIDPHVHFRTPGFTHKEDWHSGAKAAIAGGVTTVFDMPNTKPATTTLERLLEKKALIDTQLKEAHIPLHYGLFFGADKNHFAELYKIKGQVIGIKAFMGSSTGDLLMDDEASLTKLFEIAAELNLTVSVHAEDEAMIQKRTGEYKQDDFSCHSVIRSPEVAVKALELALSLVRRYGTRLYALHIGSRAEFEILWQAKQEGLPVFIEAAPHYLFLDTGRYADLHGKAQMNPPLRAAEDREFIWQAIAQGRIDTLGSDHAPHPLSDKLKSYGECPSGVPGVQTTLPLLLNACHEGKISLPKIVELTHTHPKRIFNLPDFDDWVLVDLNKAQEVQAEILYSKAGWSPYEGMNLKGWPVYTLIGDQLFDLGAL